MAFFDFDALENAEYHEACFFNFDLLEKAEKEARKTKSRADFQTLRTIRTITINTKTMVDVDALVVRYPPGRDNKLYMQQVMNRKEEYDCPGTEIKWVLTPLDSQGLFFGPLHYVEGINASQFSLKPYEILCIPCKTSPLTWKRWKTPTKRIKLSELHKYLGSHLETIFADLPTVVAGRDKLKAKVWAKTVTMSADASLFPRFRISNTFVEVQTTPACPAPKSKTDPGGAREHRLKVSVSNSGV